jgi:uncharacterized protein (DUF58 family)
MKFFSRGIAKLDYGCFVGACLAYLAQRQRDRVGLITFDNDIVSHVPAVGEALQRRAADDGSLQGGAGGQPGGPLHKMAEHFRRRGILVLISDFYEEPDTILESIKPLKFLGNDLIVFHVLDPAELDFGYEDAFELRGPRDRRADPGRPRVAGEGIPGDDPGPHRGADDQVLRATD